jgi:Protein of unknown function (DUF2892)
MFTLVSRTLSHQHGSDFGNGPSPLTDGWLALEGKVFMSRLFVKNEHSVERAMRVVLGLGLLTLTFVGPHTALGYVGLIPLATGFLGSCPLYSLLGFSTRRVQVNKGR